MCERRERKIWGILGQGGDTCEEYIELGFCRILVNFVGILGDLIGTRITELEELIENDICVEGVVGKKLVVLLNFVGCLGDGLRGRGL